MTRPPQTAPRGGADQALPAGRQCRRSGVSFGAQPPLGGRRLGANWLRRQALKDLGRQDLMLRHGPAGQRLQVTTSVAMVGEENLAPTVGDVLTMGSEGVRMGQVNLRLDCGDGLGRCLGAR